MAGRIKLRDINQDPAFRQEASGGEGGGSIPGFFGGSHGAIAFRGAEKWQTLAPGTAGYTLSTNGIGADPTWIPIVTNLSGRATGQIGLITSSLQTDVA